MYVLRYVLTRRDATLADKAKKKKQQEAQLLNNARKTLNIAVCLFSTSRPPYFLTSTRHGF